MKDQHQILVNNKNPFIDICETYLEANYGEVSAMQLEDMKGVFMAGAASFLNLFHTINHSDMPSKLKKELTENLMETCTELAGGNLVSTHVQAMRMPETGDMH